MDFGLQRVQVDLPAVFTCDLRLNTPRFPNVKEILKAKKKPVETIDLATMGIDVTPRLKIDQVDSPVERKGGVIVQDVDELIKKLREEAKIIP